MIRVKRFFFVFLFITLSASSSFAATIYVDDNASGCSTPSDTDYDPTANGGAGACGSGSFTIYNTLVGAEAALSDGDTVIVRAGEYEPSAGSYGSLEIDVANVTFQAYSGETPIIDGDTDDDETYPYNLPTHTWSGGLVKIKATGITLDGFEVRYSTKQAIHGFPGSEYMTIKNCYIHHIGGGGIQVLNYGTIEDNEVGPHISQNTGSNYCNAGLNPDPSYFGWGEAIYTGINSHDSIIRRNVAHGGCGAGISPFGAGQHDHLVEDNIIYDFTRGLVYISKGYNITVRRNLIYCSTDTTFRDEDEATCGRGISISNESDDEGPLNGHKIYNNLVAYTYNGISLQCWASGGDPATQGAEIYGNTIVEAGGGGNTALYISNNYCAEPHPTHQNIIVKNNIFVETSGTLANIPGSGITFSNNLWFKNSGDNKPEADAQGSGDVYDNPDLTKTTNWTGITAGFHDADWWELTSASPAIEAGVALGSPYNEDYDQEGRPKKMNYDIGAYEYGYVVSLVATDGAASETGPDTGIFKLSADEAVGANLVVSFSLSGGADSDDYDEDLSGGTLTILNTNTYVEQTIRPTDDATVEGEELLIMNLTAGNDYYYIDPDLQQAQIAIADNEVVEGEIGQVVFGSGTGSATRSSSGTGQLER